MKRKCCDGHAVNVGQGEVLAHFIALKCYICGAGLWVLTCKRRR